MQRDPKLKPDDTFLERWTVQELIGHGGFSEVYRVVDGAGRVGALKLLRDDGTSEAFQDLSDRLQREAMLLSQLDSPYTISLWEHGEVDSTRYLLFEFIEGRSLFDEIKKNGALSEPRVIHILRQALIGLEAAHALGILHRDIKPNNIMLYERDDDPDRVKLIDFGIAKRFDGAEQDLTHAGVLVGTPRYMSPTQLRGGKLSPATDLYALGLCAVEMLTGRRCVPGNDRIDVVRAQLQPEPVRLPDDLDISPGLVAIVHGMTEKDVTLRTATATQALRALEGEAGDPGATGDTVFQSVPSDFGKIADDDYDEDDPSDETAVDAVSGAAVDAMFGDDAFGDEPHDALAERSDVDPYGSTMALMVDHPTGGGQREDASHEDLPSIDEIEPLVPGELNARAVPEGTGEANGPYHPHDYGVGGPASDFLSQFDPPAPNPLQASVDSSLVGAPDHTPQAISSDLYQMPAPAFPAVAPGSGPVVPPPQFQQPFGSGALQAPPQPPPHYVSGPLNTPYGPSNYRPSGPLQGFAPQAPPQPQRPPIRLSTEDKVTLGAGFLVPGVGQILAGQYIKGGLVMFLTLVLVVFGTFLIWAPLAVVSLVDTFLIVEAAKRRPVDAFEFFPDLNLYR